MIVFVNTHDTGIHREDNVFIKDITGVYMTHEGSYIINYIHLTLIKLITWNVRKNFIKLITLRLSTRVAKFLPEKVNVNKLKTAKSYIDLELRMR